MKNTQIAEAIETSPVRLTSDETRAVLRAAQTDKPFKGWGGGVNKSLVELGLMAEVPMETDSARSSRLASAWKTLRVAVAAKELKVASKAIDEISEIQRLDKPEMGTILTDLGKQVARGITVRITKR